MTERSASGSSAAATWRIGTTSRQSGIMFWKLDDDTTDETSLLRVIRAAVDGGS